MTTLDSPVIPHPARPRLVIEPPSPWAAISLREIWTFRELLLNFALRDVKLRYRQTLLGVLWVVLQPLLGAAIFAFVFGKVAKFQLPADAAGRRPPYLLFAMAGMMLWHVFAGTLTRSSNSMVGNAHLVSKVYFPRIVLPLSTISSALIDFCVTLLFLLVLILFRWYLPGWNVLLLPVCLVLIGCLAMGIGLLATALAVSYRDVQFIIPVMTQLLLYLSPVAYSAMSVPAAYRDQYFLNPLAGLLEAYKWSVLSVGEVQWGYFAYSAVVCVAALVVGAYAFNWMERKFADVV
jgi:lipopolysaccharide transport system permease protein